jgi:hypothetical protein
VTRDDHDGAALHRELVDRLTDDLRPVRRPWSPWLRLACWVVLALGTVALAAALGLRHDLGTQLAGTRYLITLAALLAGAGLAATAALLVAVPGRIALYEARVIGAGVLVLAVITALLGERAPAPSTTAFVLTGLRCTACVAAFGLVPWFVLFRAVGRAAPLDGRTAGLCAGAAAVLVGAASVRVACPIDDSVHLVVWHGLPAALWTIVSVAAGSRWLARWLDARRDGAGIGSAG